MKETLPGEPQELAVPNLAAIRDLAGRMGYPSLPPEMQADAKKMILVLGNEIERQREEIARLKAQIARARELHEPILTEKRKLFGTQMTWIHWEYSCPTCGSLDADRAVRPPVCPTIAALEGE